MNYQKTTTVTLDGEVYTVNYPTVGQQLDIESMKNTLTKGQYAQLAAPGTITGTRLLDLVDALSYFSILIPGFDRKYKVKDFEKMDVLVQTKLSRAFRKFNIEFLTKIQEEINKLLVEAETGEQERKNSENEDEHLHGGE